MTQQRTVQEIKQEIKRLRAKCKKSRKKASQIMHGIPSENPSFRQLYELTNAWLETQRIEYDILWEKKRILEIERDALWWEKHFSHENPDAFEQQPDEQPLVFLADNVIQFPGERMVTQ